MSMVEFDSGHCRWFCGDRYLGLITAVAQLESKSILLSVSGSLYPLELIKTRMQVAGELNRTYRSLTKSVVSILKNEGVRGFYQGVTPALFAASGSWGGYFLVYEASKERKLKALPTGSKLGTADHVI